MECFDRIFYIFFNALKNATYIFIWKAAKSVELLFSYKESSVPGKRESLAVPQVLTVAYEITIKISPNEKNVPLMQLNCQTNFKTAYIRYIV